MASAAYPSAAARSMRSVAVWGIRSLGSSDVCEWSSSFNISQPPASDVQADGAHQRKRVAVLDDAGAHSIVEHHHAVLEPIFEMDVCGSRAERRRQLGEREIVRRDEANRARADQRADDRVRSDAPIV